ncbi:MAG: hypothetical protein WCD76_08705, partial [Pyrinomonadaceae bacterium]
MNRGVANVNEPKLMIEEANFKSRAYQATITVAGIALWVASATCVALLYAPREQLLLASLVPLVVAVCMFLHVFPMPSGLQFTQEKMTFSLSDAIILLIACWHGVIPAIVIGGIEGFITSRRAVRRLSSNLFSLGMMSLAAAAAALALGEV